MQTQNATYSWTRSSSDSPHRREEPGEAGSCHGSEDDDDHYGDGDFDDDDGALLSIPLRIRGNEAVVDGFDSSSLLHQQHSQGPGQPNTSTERAEDHLSPRQRALSEPDGVRIRDLVFQRALTAPQRDLGRIRRRHPPPTTMRSQRQQQFLRRSGPQDRGNSVELVAVSSSQLSTSAAEVMYASTLPLHHADEDTSFEELHDTSISSRQDGNGTPRVSNVIGMDNARHLDSDPDPQRASRFRWIIINQRF